MRAVPMLAASLMIHLLTAGHAAAQRDPAWTEAYRPFRIVGNLYYVGSRGLANYLIATPEGHILINSDQDANVPLIQASMKELGFSFNDVKILLISHAHFDHCGGSALIKERTGAQYMVMDADVPVVRSGGAEDFQYGADSSARYRPASVDRTLHDGDTVRLGDAVLIAHRTPGHTKGCTTWTMRVMENGRPYDVVIVGGCGVNPGYRLVGNPLYPGIARDYERTFRVLKRLPCDYFLGAHGSYFDMEAKVGRLNHETVSPFIDPRGYRSFVLGKEREFRAELARQRAAKRRRPRAAR
ncbi:MAG TPA: subclass B3 metallo-beta-lactamase [Candidatus Kapabacteria bacterium]|nr:subclass B3 metallo-beta-lactamase [Candidatus Kapabacteria bacterium]